jgi:hypothetical protein
MSAKKRKRTGRSGKKPEPVTVTNTTHQAKTLMRKIFEREGDKKGSGRTAAYSPQTHRKGRAGVARNCLGDGTPISRALWPPRSTAAPEGRERAHDDALGNNSIRRASGTCHRPVSR